MNTPFNILNLPNTIRTTNFYNYIFNRHLSKVLARLTFILFFSFSYNLFAQTLCSNVQVWSATNRGGSGQYNQWEIARLPGQTQLYWPQYFGGTTCHLTDSWCRQNSFSQWVPAGTCVNCSNGTANAGAALATIYQEA